ncbi:hypothetical protein [Falsibacillus pallidus]|uniref:hypothetical protein n=1 Tax=Falsibacillus pallidus TaxID=493781 RepID=UPI003D99253C
MYEFPSEIDFLSLFECDPTLLDVTKDFPFYYNQATYRFSNGKEDFIVNLSPSYGEVKIQVIRSDSNRLLSLLDLKSVKKFEIIADKKDHSSVLIINKNEDIEQVVEIQFKPQFKQIFKEQLIR